MWDQNLHMPFPSLALYPACLPLMSTGKYMQMPKNSYKKENVLFPFFKKKKKARLQTPSF